MKILFWTDGFWPRLGGIETQGMQFMKGLREKGHQCQILAQKERDAESDPSIKRIDFNAIINQRNLKIIREVQEYLEQILKEFQPDIIHLNACIGGSAFAFALFRKLFRAPVILTAHAPYLHEGTFPPIIAQIASSVDQICCVSDWVLKEMERHLPTLKSKMGRIYNGLPMPRSPPTAISFDPPILLLFGRLSWEKGFDTAIYAFSHLKKRGSPAQMVVAGGGPERPALERLVHELSLSHSVQFTGVLSDEEVVAAYNRATLVIVPSILESFGLVILEAMQRGRPVIASNVEGVPELLIDGQTGLLFPMKDPLCLCEAIQELLSHPEKAMAMGSGGRKRAEQFTIEHNVAQYEAVYERALLG
jgi:glycosyltransferase involved in cell wall biosynthesis